MKLTLFVIYTHLYVFNKLSWVCVCVERSWETRKLRSLYRGSGKGNVYNSVIKSFSFLSGPIKSHHVDCVAPSRLQSCLTRSHTCCWVTSSLCLVQGAMEALGDRLQLLMKTFRRECPRVLESERTTVHGADGMMMVLQLAMAEVNKQVLVKSPPCKPPLYSFQPKGTDSGKCAAKLINQPISVCSPD